MREKDFVEQNKEKWKRLEHLVSSDSQADPGELAELYTQVQNDLSYARTFYNRRSIRVYLNQLSLKVFLRLYKFGKERKNRFRSFWLEELPLALYRSRIQLNISLLFFVFASALGILSSYHDPEFPKVILGDRYVEMTEGNIAAGEPMAVYDSGSETFMFFAITINNLKVAFLTYVLGAFFAIGTLIILLFNGIMVGTFQYFFVARDLFAESFLTIWMHGALEISAIVIAGGAGLCLGSGLLFPGTLPRMQAFQITARRSVIIMLGLIPVFITAGFIEGFFTRLTALPDFFRGSFIALCFALVGLYFWWFPWKKYRNQNVDDIDTDRLVPSVDQPLTLHGWVNTREVFSATLLAFRKMALPLLGLSVGFALLYTAAFQLIQGEELLDTMNLEKSPFYNLYQFHSYSLFPKHFFLNVIFISGVLLCATQLFMRKFVSGFKSNWLLTWVKITVLVGIFELSIYSANTWVACLGILLIPFLSLWMVVFTIENGSLTKSFRRMLNLLQGTRSPIFTAFISFLLVCILVLFLVDTPLTWLYLDLVQWYVYTDGEGRLKLLYLSIVFINQFGLFLIIPGFIFAGVFEYYAAMETKEASQLAEKVEEIGKTRRAYGLEQE